NSVSHTQTITFADLGEEEFAEVEEAMPVKFDSLDGGLFIGNIFPNPVSDRAQINYAVAKTSNVTLDVLDMNGSLVQTIFSGSSEAGVTYQQMFETAGIESGVYMVRLTGNNTAKFERVVVAK
ncbi:MAG: T9SS type A sorting domain-containing protein, partial [Flavobacteriales bacterium]